MANVDKLRKRAADFEAKRQMDKAVATYLELFAVWDANDGVEADVALYNRVGDVLLREGNVGDAMSVWETAVDYYAERGFHNNAIALCNKILRHSPGRTSVYYKLGKYSAMKGFRADAKRNFLEYADRMQKAQKMDEAFRALKEFADLCPDEDDIRQMLADQFARLDRKQEAIEQLQMLYERYESLGQSAEAAATVERIKAIDPTVEPKRAGPARTRESSGLVFLDLNEPSPRPSRQVFVTPAPPPPRPSKPQPPAMAGLPLIDLDDEVDEQPAQPVAEAEPIAAEGLEPTAAPVATPTPAEQVPIVADITFGASFGTEEGGGEAPDATQSLLDVEPTGLAPDANTEPVSSLLGSPEDSTFGTGSAAFDATGTLADIESPFGTFDTPPEPAGESSPLDAASEDAALPFIAIDPTPAAVPVVEAPAEAVVEHLDLIEAEASDSAVDALGLIDAVEIGEPQAPRESVASGAVDVVEPVEVAESTELVESVELVETVELAESVEVLDLAEDAEVDELVAAPEVVDVVDVAPPRRSTRSVLSALAKSVDTLRERVAAEPGNWNLHREFGEALLEDGDREGGLAELEAAVAGFEQDGDLESARSVTDELILLNPHSVRHHQKRVEFAFRMNDQARLIDSYLELAGALFQDGQTEKSRAVYQRVIELAPEDSRAREALETFPAAEPPPAPAPDARTTTARRYTAATPMRSEQIQAQSPAPEPAASSDNSFVDLGDWLREDEAPKSTRMVVEEKEPTGDEDADFTDMLRKFKQGVAANVDEEDFDSHYDLGVAYKEMGLVDEAIAEFQKALRGTTNRVRSYEALGQCFTEKGQSSVAMTILQRALAEPGVGDDQLVGVLYLLGNAAESLGQPTSAVAYYQRVFAVDINFRDVQARMRTLEQARS